MENLKKNLSGQRKGFSMAEVLVSLVVFSLFSLGLVYSLTYGIRCFRKAEAAHNAHNTCISALEVILNDLNQAIPNPDPGRINTPTGYLSISPAVELTAFLIPNNNSKTSNKIKFNMPNFTNMDIAGANPPVDKLRPDLYRQVEYYTSNNALYRKITNIDAAGILSAETPLLIAEAGSKGSITLHAEFKSPKVIKVTLKVREDIGTPTESEYEGSTVVSCLLE
jgi:prepilin-type N-terminal cleavage/methylation domain-containing protein